MKVSYEFAVLEEPAVKDGPLRLAVPARCQTVPGLTNVRICRSWCVVLAWTASAAVARQRERRLRISRAGLLWWPTMAR
jgi:hypothetical protein